MSTQQRNRVSAVYLTDSERDLVRSALHELKEQLQRTSCGSDWEVKFAKSFTAMRIIQTASLFIDKPSKAEAN